MNPRVAGFCAMFGLGLTGLSCDVGSGGGEAKGPVFFEGCEVPFGDPANPGFFDLSPSFFAGEPVEDIRKNDTQNRLTVRLQRHGGGFEVNDVLQFDVVNSYEVARCVRGRMKKDANGAVVPDFRTDICFWAFPLGPARVRVGPNDFIRATLTPYETCRSQNAPFNLVAAAVPCQPVKGLADCPGLPPDQWASFVEFQTFGGTDVRGSGQADELPKAVPGDFKVDFGERVKVTRFVLDLVDQHFLAEPTGVSTPTKPAAFGRMEGWFDFKLERGRAVQTFP